MKTLEFAEYYHKKLGWNIIPIKYKQKIPDIPAWKPYMTTRGEEKDLTSWWGDGAKKNIAVVCGSISNVAVLDCDSPEAELFIKTNNLPLTWTYTSARGPKLVYSLPHAATFPTIPSLSPGLDFLCEGHYVLVPDSVHPNGTKYNWLVERSPWDNPVLTSLPDIILAMIKKKLSPSNQDPVHQSYFRGVPETQRGDTILKAARRLFGTGLKENEVWDICKALNLQNSPPMTETELKIHYRGALAYHKKEDPEPAKILENWLIPAPEFMNEEIPPTQWLIENIWTEAGVGFVGGEPKAYKSRVVNLMAFSIATGHPLFNKFAVPNPGKVILIDEENKKQNLQRIISQTLKSHDIDAGYLKLLSISCQNRLMLDNIEWQTKIMETIEKEQPRAVIFDPLVRMHSFDENNLTEMSKIFKFFRNLQIVGNCSVIVCHHFKKSTAEQQKAIRPGQLLRGSSDFHALSDSSIYVHRLKTMPVIEVRIEHRGAPEPEPFMLAVSSEDPEMFEFQYQSGEVENIFVAETMEKILSLLKKANGMLTTNEIKVAIRGTWRSRALDKLIETGQIQKAKLTSNNRIKTYYHLPKEDDFGAHQDRFL